MQSLSKLQPAHRCEASANLLADIEHAQNPTTPLPRQAGMKRGRSEEANAPASTQGTSAGKCPRITETSATPAILEKAEGEDKKKWDGKKERSVSTIIAQATDSGFLRLSDTLNLSDVWFLPRKVARTGSLAFLSVELSIVINGVSLVMHDHMYKLSAEELLKMIYLARKMRACCEGAPFPLSFAQWREREFNYFTTSPDVVRGDSSDAAFAEYEFCHENFILMNSGRKCALRCVFRKSAQHIYKNDTVGGTAAPILYGLIENPNVELCTATRGNYSYCIEVRVMYIGGEEEVEVEELPDSQTF